MRITESLLCVALVGCADRPVGAVYPEQVKVETKDLPSNPNREVDILFLVDSSGSMAEEQASLRANFPKFMDVLQTIEGGMPNVHIGVTTSSLGQRATDGIGTASIQGCSGAGDDGALTMDPLVSGRYIIDEESGASRNRNYTGTLGDAFAALADVGGAGCGIEQHLGAVERALTNPVNAGFVRPAAKLAVIFIADEDDCSLAHNNLFESGVDGPVLNFRCTKHGIECDGGNPDLDIPGLRTDCRPKLDSPYLEPVDRYVDFIKDLKPTWREDVIVAGIVGDTEPFEIVKNQQQQSVLKPSCEYGGSQTAFPAVRTGDFLAQFNQSVQETICEGDLSAAMVKIGVLLKRSFGDPCWEGQVADLDPSTPGLQAECTVSDVRRHPDGSEQELAVIPSCSTGRIPCWRLEEDATQCHYTTTKLKLVIDRGGVIPPADVHVKASCVTTDPDGGPFM